MSPDLNIEQQAAANAPEKVIAIMAGPGSGKTRVLAARVAWLVGAQRVNPGKVLAFTFTRAAAAELRARVRGALGDDLGDLVRVTTFHAWAIGILRRFPEAAGLPLTFTPVGDDDEEAEHMLRGLYHGALRRPEAAHVTLSRLKAARMAYAATGEPPPDRDQATLLATWRARLARIGIVPVTDALPMLWTAMRSDERVAQAVLGVEALLVDEAQDATLLERAFVYAIRNAESAWATYACDPRQAIFGWRTGIVRPLVRDVADAGGAVYGLARCHRFGARIAERANDWARVMGRHPELEPEQATLAPPEIIGVAEQEGTASKCPREKLRAHVEHLATTYGPANVAVLVRSHEQGRLAEQDLGALAERIPSGTGTRGDVPAWLLFASWIARVATNRADEVAFRKLWEQDVEAGHRTVAQLADLEERAGRARALADQAKYEGGDGPGLVAAALRMDPTAGFDVAGALAFRHLYPDNPTTGVDRSYLLGSILQAYGVVGLDLRGGLEALADRHEGDGWDVIARRGKVAIGTAHAAKGREWDAVVIVLDNAWLKRMAREPEEGRVYYVALTRARKHVVTVTEVETARLAHHLLATEGADEPRIE